jgi:hypothetical protein
LPFGHFFKGHKPDRIIGDAKFLRAANETFQVLSGDHSASLTVQQVNDLIASEPPRRRACTAADHI